MVSGLSCLQSIALLTQFGSATLTGVVRDEALNTPLPEVVVTLVEEDRMAHTDSAGVYLFVLVDPGPRHLTVQRIGYSPRTLHALVPRIGSLEIDIALRAEPISLEEVNVRAPVPLRGLEGADASPYPDRGLSMAAVRHHPLVAEPDALQAIGGGEISLDPESPSGIHIRGSSADQVAYLLDDIPVLSPYHAAGTFTAWNPDALSRIDLTTYSSGAFSPDALAGVVDATTRQPGQRLRVQGGLSSSQARVTLDGPIGPAGLLFSARSSFPGLLLRGSETSYIRGDASDLLGKIEIPMFTGQLALLGAGSETEIDTSARVGGDSLALADPRKNTFAWDNATLGATWSRSSGYGTFRFQSWSVQGNADATWSVGDSLPATLRSVRRDHGLAGAWFVHGERSSLTLGVSGQETRTRYALRAQANREMLLAYTTRDPITAAFAQGQHAIGPRIHAEATLRGSLLDGTRYFSPSAQVRWDATSKIAITAGYTRRHQFAQSLRSSESVIGNIFPADLYVGSSRDGVPVARSHQGVLSLEARPSPGTRVGLQIYAREFDQLVLVAPRDPDPFATSGFVDGSGTAKGIVLEAATNNERYGVLTSYGYQDADLRYSGKRYTPEYSSGHSIDAGLVVYPSVTSSVRLGLMSLFGRRGTAALGAFEWESCNLLDPGCELAGNPARSDDLGGERLPAYLRLDLGVRKHWHLEGWGRDWLLEVFGSATNLLARKNILTIAIDPATGRRTEIEMRPLSPLVVGIDWKF